MPSDFYTKSKQIQTDGGILSITKQQHLVVTDDFKLSQYLQA